MNPLDELLKVCVITGHEEDDGEPEEDPERDPEDPTDFLDPDNA